MADANRTNDWVSVADRTPEPYEDVLCVFPGGDCRYDICNISDEGYWTLPNKGFEEADCEPTHWMPLPELPP